MPKHRIGRLCSSVVLLGGAAFCPAFALDTPALPASPNIPNRSVALNAPADGVTDATAAINSAIASLSQAGGGTLQFADGTYLVRVNPKSNDVVLAIQNNVRLQGAADGGTIIKLADGQPAYNTLIGNCCHVYDVDIENLTIDMNGLNNAVTSDAARAAGPRFAIRVDEGARARVANCKVVNVDDVNTFVFNGPVSDVEVANNSFVVGMPVGSFDFDHSTIYTHAARIWVHGNTLTAANGPGTPVARTAIEIHGDDMTVANNTVDGYATGVIITGIAVSSNRQLYENNTIRNVMDGMMIDTYQDPNPTSPYGMQNITIQNNQITLDPFSWRLTPLVGYNQPSMGIFLNPNFDNPSSINGLSIVGNQITFPLGGAPVSGDATSGGIVFWTYNGQMLPISNLYVAQNTIKDALGPAIWSNETLTGGTTIQSNTILDPARSSAWGIEKTGIYISGTTNNMTIQTNTVADSGQSKPVTKIGISALSTCEIKDQCISRTNTVTPWGTVTRSVLGPGWVH